MRLAVGNRKGKCRALSRLRYHPNLSAITPNDFFADGESNATSRHVLAMKALERFEDDFAILRLDADAIVGDVYLPAIPGHCALDMNMRSVGTPVFNGVADKVLK